MLQLLPRAGRPIRFGDRRWIVAAQVKPARAAQQPAGQQPDQQPAAMALPPPGSAPQPAGNRLGNLGSAYRSLGRQAEAIDHHTQALAISREV
eukprot:SAG22_NODE_8183_length_676_cov_1.103986_1_plen_92_part_01